jgi:tRNA-uridine 2-sulfurtransferase
LCHALPFLRWAKSGRVPSRQSKGWAKLPVKQEKGGVERLCAAKPPAALTIWPVAFAQSGPAKMAGIGQSCRAIALADCGAHRYLQVMLNSLGFAKTPAQTRVVVAMSGGVDSSVVAAMLKAEGYDVVGVTLQLYDHGVAVEKKGACCAGADIHDARQAAAQIGIPHYVLDYENRFKQAVMDAFADSYLAGETPIPCIQCNKTVKFRDLLDMAQDLGADCLATGHYVQRLMGADGPELHAGVDPNRDQSYFLFTTTANQLDYLRFPLGGLEKPAVRALADKFGLAVADKPDSQDICFVPTGRYVEVVQRLRPGAQRPGDIVHVNGEVLGQHEGIIGYTIGQRKGLRVGGQEEPLYVVKLDPARNRVIVGPKHALLTSEIRLRDMNWLAGPVDREGVRAMIKVRSAAKPLAARIFLEGQGGRAVLETPEAGVAPGQACVAYAEGRVLGGGWIASAVPAMQIAALDAA